MIKVLFVCLGNICRSPLAEAIFNHKIAQNKLESKISCNSAGTANYHVGESPDPRTIEVANNHGIDVNHRGQQFKKADSGTYDYLLAMDHSNLSNMVYEIGNKPEHLLMMRDFDPMAKGTDVPDPWYGGMSGFEDVYQILDRSSDEFLQFLKEKHNL